MDAAPAFNFFFVRFPGILTFFLPQFFMDYAPDFFFLCLLHKVP